MVASELVGDLYRDKIGSYLGKCHLSHVKPLVSRSDCCSCVSLEFIYMHNF